MDIKASCAGARVLAAELGGASIHVEQGTSAIVEMYGELMATRVKAFASGRPGPNAPTGDYRRSWTAEFTRKNGNAASQVGTNKVQGRRLEFGFVGADSLGRIYNQPPYEHLQPAIDVIEPLFYAAMSTYLKAVLP